MTSSSTDNARRLLARTMTEASLQAHVMNAMQRFGWRRVHFRPAQTSKGWRTAVEGDGEGFPDIVAVRPPRSIYAELKSAKGTVTPEQQVWLDDCAASGHEAYVWRPMDWLDGSIERLLMKEVSS